MVARFHPCCTRGELQAALARSLPDPSDLKLENHLAQCAACREELERIAAGPQWWERARSYLSDVEHPSSGDESRGHDKPVTIETRRAGAATVSAADRAQLLSWLPSGLLQPSPEADKFGSIGTYEVLEPIGRGGMGVVLKAFDPALNRYVAIKVLAAEFAHNASARRRFAREAQAAAAVVHDHVVPIYAVDGTGPNPYLVMAYIPGRSLQERIDETGPLEVREILRIGMQTATGLAAAHAQGLVHRDIKPANILLENGVERVRITDFGLARAMDEASQTQSGVLAGTPQYMAPEQASGEAIDYRTDLFSLGSVLYAMCTGHSPFRAETTVAVLRRICDGAPRPVREINPDIPHWLAAIIDKLLAKRPSERFGSAEEVARVLAEQLAQVQHPLCRRSPIRRKLIAAAAGAIVATMALVALIANYPNEPGGLDASTAQQRVHNASESRASSNASAQENARNTVGPLMNLEAFDTELRSVSEHLSRLEARRFENAARTPPFGELRAIDATLDAMERDIPVAPILAEP